MRTYAPEELDSILDKHKKWFGGKEGGERANLTEANLTEANLYRANLRGANLRGADLRGADLTRANLYGADLRGADMFTAYLCEANLRGADLREANLTGANLYGADLRGADMYGADLFGANLYGAKMNWRSHDLIAELLRRHAKDDPEKRKVAGLILVSRDWCWADFQQKCGSDPLFTWAIQALRQHVRDGDDTPDLLREDAGL